MPKHAPSEILCHPDKIEVFIVNSASNRHVLHEVFPGLMKTWTERFCLRRRNECKAYRWEIYLWNEELRLTFSGSPRDLVPRPSWHENPFHGSQARNQYPGSGRSMIATLRITDKKKVSPRHYSDCLSQILADFETCGIEERPRIIEVALDCYTEELSRFVYRTVRLTRDKPLKFCHYKNGAYQPGGSPDGDNTEYSMRPVFQTRKGYDEWQNARTRELICYSRPEYPFYRVEIRLGYRFLDRFFKSDEYHRSMESSEIPLLVRDYPVKAPSRTLDLLGFIPYFVRTQLAFETIDVERLYRNKPFARFLALHDKSLREQRFRIASQGLKVKTTAVSPPPIHYVLPRQIELST